MNIPVHFAKHSNIVGLRTGQHVTDDVAAALFRSFYYCSPVPITSMKYLTLLVFITNSHALDGRSPVLLVISPHMISIVRRVGLSCFCPRTKRSNLPIRDNDRVPRAMVPSASSDALCSTAVVGGSVQRWYVQLRSPLRSPSSKIYLQRR